MTGTLLNAAGIVIGGLLGLLLKKIIPERINEPIIKAEGVAIIFIALLGAFKIMMGIKDGELTTSGELLLLVSLVVGVVSGELLKIDDTLNRAANGVEKKLNIKGFSEGFVSATLIFSIGAIAIMGPLNEVLYGDRTLILVKTMLDSVTALLLAVTLGYGVLVAALPVLAVQGLVVIFARAISAVPSEIISQICMVGYAIVFCIGLNFVADAKIKTANLLPALLVPILYNLIILL